MVDKYLEYWADKNILITGGSSGIGFAIASYVNGVAKNIVIVAQNVEVLQEAESKLLAKSGHSNILAVKCDVGDSSSVNLMANIVIADVGCPHILINNAGFAYYHTFDQMTEVEVEETANVNFTGFLRVTRIFIPHIIKSKSSSCIVNIASVAGSFPITPNSVYGGAKAGMMAFSELLEIELRSFGVNVLTVCPGRVVTPFFDHDSYKTRKAGAETSITTPIEDVVQGVVKSVALGKKLVFIPKYWRSFSWWLNFDRLVSRCLYKSFLAYRVAKLRKK
jgi:short-subunit dehydrogenase